MKKIFEEYLSEPDTPKWEKISTNGKKFAFENFNNDKSVTSLVDLIKNLMWKWKFYEKLAKKTSKNSCNFSAYLLSIF